MACVSSVMLYMGVLATNPKPPEQKFIKRMLFRRTPSHEQKK